MRPLRDRGPERKFPEKKSQLLINVKSTWSITYSGFGEPYHAARIYSGRLTLDFEGRLFSANFSLGSCD